MATHTARDLDLNIDKARLKELYATTPYRHAMAMAANWFIILGTAYLTATYFHPLLYILAILIIGARMHALAILMHDATHFRFLKNRKLSDLLTNIFCMYPLFSSLDKYRPNHLKHHQHLNTDDDPDWFVKIGRKDFEFPKSKQEFLLTVFSYFTLVKGFQDAIWFLKRFNIVSSKKPQSFNQKLPKMIFYIIAIVLISVLGIWKEFALYWVIPYFSTFFMFQYIRSVAEHFGELEYDHLLTNTRTIKMSWIERFFLAPHNVGYHLEHHLYPGVPYYHLPALHNLLMSLPEYKHKAHVTHGFWQGLMNELGR
ncbi:MAG: fatty acid desaturase family protein [Bacteroidota bacterium]